jgi:hypothetical protein
VTQTNSADIEAARLLLAPARSQHHRPPGNRRPGTPTEIRQLTEAPQTGHRPRLRRLQVDEFHCRSSYFGSRNLLMTCSAARPISISSSV